MAIIDDLYARHLRTVYGFFMVKTMHRPTAEDLTSDVFTTALEQLQAKGEAIEDPDKYLYGIMKLKWTQYLRTKYDKPLAYVEDIDDFATYARQSVDDFQAKSLAERAAPYIAKLPARQREVLSLRFLEGQTLAAICQTLGKDMNYVKTTQKRGLASLRQLVAAGPEEDPHE